MNKFSASSYVSNLNVAIAIYIWYYIEVHLP